MAKTKNTVEIGDQSWTRSEWKQMLADADHAADEYARRWPQVTAVRYDRATKSVVLNLNNGAHLSIPATKLQSVAGATEDQRANVSILGPNWAIQFPKIDQQFTVEELLCGVFGNKAWMTKLNRKSGKSATSTRVSAARTNIRKPAARRKAVTA